MGRPVRVAILECDQPLDKIRAKYGSYGDVFALLLNAGVKELAQESSSGESPIDLSMTYYDVVNDTKYPELESTDAVLLTGSRYNSFDNDEWIVNLVNFTRKVLTTQTRVRVIGVCFGHQIVGRALGAKVDRSDRGWEVSVVPMTLTAKGKEVFGVTRDEMSLHQMHRDVVYEYPTSSGDADEGVADLGQVEALASSDRCVVQGMYVKDRLITVQGHPEFSEEILADLLEKRHHDGIFDDEMFEEGMERVGKRHDGLVVSKAFLRFLLEE